MEIIKKCLVCSNDFTAKSNKAKYCSDACKLVAFRKREKLRVEHETSYEETEKRNDLEELKEKYEALEQNFGKMQQDMVNNQIYFVKNFVSSDEILPLKENYKENKEYIRNLEKKLETVLNENMELKDELHKLKLDFKEIIRINNNLQDDNNKIARLLNSQEAHGSSISILENLIKNENLIEKLLKL